MARREQRTASCHSVPAACRPPGLSFSGIYVRDQLLDYSIPGPSRLNNQRDSLREVHDSMETRLIQIADLVPLEQAFTVEELWKEITGYWESVAPVMEDPVGATTNQYAALRDQMLSRFNNATPTSMQHSVHF